VKLQNNLNARLRREIAALDPYLRQRSPEHYEVLTHVIEAFKKTFIEFVAELVERPITEDEFVAIKELLQINGEVTLVGLLDIKAGKGDELIWGMDEVTDSEDIDLDVFDDAA
jgi:hypothetical protein